MYQSRIPINFIEPVWVRALSALPSLGPAPDASNVVPSLINFLCLKTSSKLRTHQIIIWQIYSRDELLHRRKSKSHKQRHFSRYNNTCFIYTIRNGYS